MSIDWEKAPIGKSEGTIVLVHGNNETSIKVPIDNQTIEAAGFVENNGDISIEAAKFNNKSETKDIQWEIVPNLGRTHDAVTMMPTNAPVQTPGAGTPALEYEFTIFDESEVQIQSYLSPTLNFKKEAGLKFAIAIDDEAPQIINMHEGENKPDWEYPAWWNDSVTDHIKKKTSNHGKLKAGRHTLKVWMVNPGIVFQKFIVDLGGLKPSYLGPPESVFVEENGNRGN